MPGELEGHKKDAKMTTKCPLGYQCLHETECPCVEDRQDDTGQPDNIVEDLDDLPEAAPDEPENYLLIPDYEFWSKYF